MVRIVRAIETIVLVSRWVVAPFLLGLIVGLAAMLYAFVVKLAEFVTHVRSAPEDEIIVGILKLIDFTLIANLILFVICSGYENFLARIAPADYAKWPRG
jgi:uncharacterized protein (TIGR00645 family)